MIWLDIPIFAFAFASLSHAYFFLSGQKRLYGKVSDKLLIIPALLAPSIGLGVNNGRAVIEALIGYKTGFARTPKQGDNALNPSTPAAAFSQNYKVSQPLKLKAFNLFAFSPLFLFEAGAGAHLDIICVMGIAAALLAIKKEAFIAAGVFIGLAATVKFSPAVLAGPFLFYHRPKRALMLCASAALSFTAVYALMFGLGYKPLGLLPTFFEKWRGGAPLYPLLEAAQHVFGLSQTYFLAGLGALAAYVCACGAHRGACVL